MTGRMPHTGPSSVIKRREAQQEALDIPAIRVAVAEYIKVAAANADYQQKRNAEHLNKHARKLKELKVGDMVKIYAPPSHSEAVRRKRKQKHMRQWIESLHVIAKK
jgi:hypothetical protein